MPASFCYLNIKKENWQEFVFTASVGYRKSTPLAKTQRHCSCLTYIHKLHIGFWPSGLIQDLNGHRNLYCFSLRNPDPLEKEKKVTEDLVKQQSEKLDSITVIFDTLCRSVRRHRTEHTQSCKIIKKLHKTTSYVKTKL